jgi:hypothetical protein
MDQPGARSALRHRTTGVLLALALPAGGLLAGCGGDDHRVHRSTPAPSVSPKPAAAPAPRVKAIHVTGGPLSGRAKRMLSRQVAAAVGGWFRAAYVGGDYPRARRTFRAAFPGFTAGAVAAADRNLGLMSNAAISTRIDTVKAGPQVLWLDVLGHHGHAVGVTARVKLVYGTSGRLVSRQVVRGQLNLTWRKGGWRVFGFDITRDQQQPKGGGS